MLESTIPTILMSGIFATDAKASTKASREALLKAFETSGIAYLQFDKETRSLLDEVLNPAFRQSKSFFSRPHQSKQTTITKLPPGVTRGYLGTAVESGADELELKEALSWSYDWTRDQTPTNSFEARNVWPSGSDDMQKAFNDLFKFFARVVYALSEALEKELDLPLREIAENGESISLVRAFHYHATDDRYPAATGSCAHTDWGFATLVAQEPSSEPALEANVSGWVPIPPRDGTLVVNASDFLSLITKGRLKSPLHRVMLTKSERFSFVHFHYPGYDTPMPDAVVKGISLLKNQRPGGGKVMEVSGRKFGEVIAEKWGQVNRDETTVERT